MVFLHPTAISVVDFPLRASGVAEAGVVPTAVPCFKSNEPPLGDMSAAENDDENI